MRPRPVSDTDHPLFNEVMRLLAPDLGEPMARAAVRVHLSKAGVAVADFRPAHLTDLAARLRGGLKVFVGAERAESLVAAVENLGRSRP
jgi:hypothetical protein